MSINVSELIWTIINFVVLYFLLNHFLYKPVRRFVDQRNAKIQAGLDAEAEAQQALEAQEAQLQEALSQQHAEAKAYMAKAKKETRGQCAQLRQQAVTEAAAQSKVVEQKIGDEREACAARVQENMPELVIMLADRLMQNNAATQQGQEIREYVAASHKAN